LQAGLINEIFLFFIITSLFKMKPKDKDAFGKTTVGLVQHGFAKSGAEQLRLDIFARFNFRSSIELLCKKSPPSAILEPLTESIDKHLENDNKSSI
jgi:hypothetical protein